MNAKFLTLIFIVSLFFVSCSDENGLPGGSGLIEATEITISSETNGTVEQMRFEEGSRVVKGDTLAVIDTVYVSLSLRQAEAAYSAAIVKKDLAGIAIEQAKQNFELAQKEFDRVKSLLKSGSANQQQYDRAKNAYIQADLGKKQARSSLEAANADIKRIEAEIALLIEQLDNCFPTVPQAGTITSKYVDAGELVTIGKAIYKIARLDSVWVKVYLPPSDLTKIKLGGEANIDTEDGDDNVLKGNITWISSEAEFTPKNVQTKEARADLVYAVKITIPNLDGVLKVGMPVSVTIP